MSEVEFGVHDPGQPRLGGEDASAEDQVGGAEDALGAGPAAGWTPDQVGASLASWWNLGVLWFGPEWQARPAELAQLSAMLPPYFDQWFPRGAGGDPGLVMVALAALGTGLTMALTRAPQIARHLRRPWLVEQMAIAGQLPGPAPATAAGSSGGDVPPPAAPVSEPAQRPGGSSFHLPRELAAVVDAGGESLDGLGIAV